MKQKHFHLFALSMLVAIGPLPAVCQSTRAEELGKLRLRHLEILTREEVSGTERFLRKLKEEKSLERINYGFNGLSFKVGGVVTGGGLAVGPQYVRDDLRNGAIAISASAQASLKQYHKEEAQLSLPKLASGHMAFSLHAAHRNYPGINYYGPGPDSPKTRTDYRLEDSSADAALAFTPAKFVKVGGAAGTLLVNVGPGTDKRYISTDVAFAQQPLPGLNRQTNFRRLGAFGQFDWRDDPLAPRQGGSYVVQYTRFEDYDLRRHDFNLIDVDLQQYVGFFNRSRVIALRAHTKLTDTRAGQSVPFYLQPIVGGSDDLRGFRPFRFSGNNSLVLNGEYRWAIFSGLDGAVFADAGKVFDRRGQLNFSNLEASTGFGLRFNARNQTFMRLDVGFSHEGFQVWFKFTDIFQRRPLGTADSQPVL